MPFWNRPNVERYVVPIVLPIAVIVGLVVFVLSISRIFLSAHGHIPVIVASVILLLILVGATLLSKAAHRLNQSSLAMVTIGFIVAIMFAGVVVLGHSEEKKEAAVPTLPSDLKTTQTLKVVAAPGGDLKFVPSNGKLKTGLAKIEVAVAASGHTFALTDPTTQFKTLNLDAQGAKVAGVAFFGKDGTYDFLLHRRRARRRRNERHDRSHRTADDARRGREGRRELTGYSLPARARHQGVAHGFHHRREAVRRVRRRRRRPSARGSGRQ